MNTNLLHITNGDSAADTMTQAGIDGRILPWRDILHDGPVPAGLSLEQLAELRADFLQQPPVADRDAILRGFHERDGILHAFRNFDGVLIWLEHDLYDQLQLLQLLHWFAGQELGRTILKLICIDHFDGVIPFYGLGQLSTDQMRSLLGPGQRISHKQLALGYRGWRAFTADTPLVLLNYLRHENLSALPFMAAALKRHLEEFPDSKTGLSRHERQILEMVAAGETRPGRLFGEHQKRESAPYLGDWGFWSLIENLANAPDALLKTADGTDFVRPPGIADTDAFFAQRLQLTQTGRAVLQGKVDWIALNPPDRWKGGVHLHPDKTIWRWDTREQTIVETPEPVNTNPAGPVARRKSANQGARREVWSLQMNAEQRAVALFQAQPGGPGLFSRPATCSRSFRLAGRKKKPGSACWVSVNRS